VNIQTCKVSEKTLW